MSTTPYAAIGGEEAVRALVERFYDLMDLEADFAGIRRLHAASLDGAREKLFLYLSGWLGGPPLYVERFGHPYLRARHLPFPIGIAERDQWLQCMQRALADTGTDEAIVAGLMQAFSQLANHMRNKDG